MAKLREGDFGSFSGSGWLGSCQKTSSLGSVVPRPERQDLRDQICMRVCGVQSVSISVASRSEHCPVPDGRDKPQQLQRADVSYERTGQTPEDGFALS